MGSSIKILVQGTTHELPGKVGENVLSILRPLHKTCIVSGCRNGGCGICEVKILKGDYYEGCASKRRAYSDDDTQTSLACKTFALSDMVVEIVKPLQRSKAALFGFIAK